MKLSRGHNTARIAARGGGGGGGSGGGGDDGLERLAVALRLRVVPAQANNLSVCRRHHLFISKIQNIATS